VASVGRGAPLNFARLDLVNLSAKPHSSYETGFHDSGGEPSNTAGYAMATANLPHSPVSETSIEMPNPDEDDDLKPQCVHARLVQLWVALCMSTLVAVDPPAPLPTRCVVDFNCTRACLCGVMLRVRARAWFV
jgi:hypothetical protein